MREEPPRREQMPPQALGASSEMGKWLWKGMLVRSVCLKGC
jgi:hypothetical protein